jgi:hypothetical protein
MMAVPPLHGTKEEGEFGGWRGGRASGSPFFPRSQEGTSPGEKDEDDEVVFHTFDSDDEEAPRN